MGNPLDWACPHLGCDAQPGEKCTERKDLGSSYVELDSYHPERILQAISLADATAPTVAEMHQALVDDPGDIPY